MISHSAWVSAGMLVATALAAPNSWAQTVKADHSTVDAQAIPSESLGAARALRMSFSHASVGGNIWSGLQTLGSNSAFAFPNWKDNNRGNPGWQAKITQFETWVADHINDFDVFQNKFCYIDQDADFGTYRDSMNALAAKYPAKTFVWWTMPIMTNDGDNTKRQAFNQQVRAYCAANNRPLFDLADIESHKSDQSAVTSSGVEAQDPEQSSDGGHLSALGASRAAQAQWVLMAQITGWKPGNTPATGGAASTGGSTMPTSSAQGGTASTGGQTVANTQVGSSSSDSGCAVAERKRSPARALGIALIAMVALVAARWRRATRAG